MDTEQKQWWQSRTIWLGIMGTLFSIFSGLGIIPEGLTSEMVVDAILGVVSVGAIVFRVKATKAITIPTKQ